MRVEGDRLMVTAQGPIGDHPPRDLDGYQEFLDSLRVPISKMLRDAEPLTPVYLFARTASRRNAFEDVENWPGGLVAVGDAVCAFNPVYGQGMTVAAMEALLFRRHKDFSAKGCRDVPAEDREGRAGGVVDVQQRRPGLGGRRRRTGRSRAVSAGT